MVHPIPHIVDTLYASVLRMWLTFVLAVVLSAIEVERTISYTEPDPVVMVLPYPPIRTLRLRPFKPHYRGRNVY